jgi:hypothetical protein
VTDERPFEAIHISDVPLLQVMDTLAWRPVRRHLGIGAFGVNAYTAANAGDHVVEPHDETGAGAGQHEELYVVLAGRATFAIAGEEVEGPAGPSSSFATPLPGERRSRPRRGRRSSRSAARGTSPSGSPPGSTTSPPRRTPGQVTTIARSRSSRRDSRSSRTTRRFSTTSPATSHSPGATRRRLRISARPSTSTAGRWPGPRVTATSSRSATTPPFRPDSGRTNAPRRSPGSLGASGRGRGGPQDKSSQLPVNHIRCRWPRPTVRRSRAGRRRRGCRRAP